MESVLRIDQVAIDSGRRTYGSNGRLINEYTGNNVPIIKILKNNRNAMTDGVTDQPPVKNVRDNYNGRDYYPTNINVVDHPQNNTYYLVGPCKFFLALVFSPKDLCHQVRRSMA